MNESNMKRTCPVCEQEVFYKSKHRFNEAVKRNGPCKSCAICAAAKNPERRRKISENAKKRYKDYKENDPEKYREICNNVRLNNSSLWSDPKKKLAWKEKRSTPEFKNDLQERLRNMWATMTESERNSRIEKMVKTRKDRGTIGNNNKKRTGIFEGVTFQSSCEEKFLKKFIHSYKIKNCDAISGDGFLYQPDFWSDELSSYIEVKSKWTFEVFVGIKNYNSKDRKNSKQLEKIKKLRNDHKIILCIELNNEFYFVDPLNIHENISTTDMLREECQNLLTS